MTTVTASDLADVPVVDGPGTETMHYVHTLEGELRWSLTANRLAGPELVADIEAEHIMETDASNPVDFLSTVPFEGEATYKIEVE